MLDGSLEMTECLEKHAADVAQRGRPHDSQDEGDVENVDDNDDEEAGE